MTKDKDIKRLVRERMRKTGESYTTARAHLAGRTPGISPAPPAQAYAVLAGMSDETIEAKTGLAWEGWVMALDQIGASSRPHREIAQHVLDNWDVSGWWAQTITVGYERIKGLRATTQRRDGSWEATKSRTFPVAVSTLFETFAEDELRQRWLPEIDLVVRKATPDKSMRITWPDGTSLEVYFTAKGPTRSSVQVQHTKLASAEAVDSAKAYWAAHLAILADLLATG